MTTRPVQGPPSHVLTDERPQGEPTTAATVRPLMTVAKARPPFRDRTHRTATTAPAPKNAPGPAGDEPGDDEQPEVGGQCREHVSDEEQSDESQEQRPPVQPRRHERQHR